MNPNKKTVLHLIKHRVKAWYALEKSLKNHKDSLQAALGSPLELPTTCL